MATVVLKVFGLVIVTLVVAVTLVAWLGRSAAAETSQLPSAAQQTTLNQVRNTNQLVLTSEGGYQLRVTNQAVDPYAIQAAATEPGFFDNLHPLAAIFVGLAAFYCLAFSGLLIVILAQKTSQSAYSDLQNQ